MSANARVEEVSRLKSIRNNIDWLTENLMPVRVIYSDIDGTLVGPLGNFFMAYDGELTLRPARAMVAAHARNIDVMLVSGRHKSQLRETGRLLGCLNYVAELGTEIVYNLGMEVITNTGALELTCDSVYRSVLQTGVVDMLLEAYPRKLEMHTPWSDERDCTPLLRGYVDTGEVHERLREHSYEQFQLVDNGVIPRKSPTLDVPETRAYHLVPLGVSKELAVQKDQEHRGFKRAETVAAGDAEADLPLADAVGAFFMVRNGFDANPHLADKIAATPNVFITEGRMGDGWSEVVETLLGLTD